MIQFTKADEKTHIDFDGQCIGTRTLCAWFLRTDKFKTVMNKFKQEMRRRLLTISTADLYKRYPAGIGRVKKVIKIIISIPFKVKSENFKIRSS